MIAYTQELYNDTAGSGADDNTTATPIITKHGKEATIYLNITVGSGTLDLILKIYNSGAATWHTLATFNQKTEPGTDVGYIDYGIGEKMALYYVVSDGGSFTFSVNVGIKER